MGANRVKILGIDVSGTHMKALAIDRNRKNAWNWLGQLLSRS